METFRKQIETQVFKILLSVIFYKQMNVKTNPSAEISTPSVLISLIMAEGFHSSEQKLILQPVNCV